MSEAPGSPAVGRTAPDVAEELPGLALHWVAVAARDRASPANLVSRLRQLSNGYRGAAVVAMRTKPVPSAYRRFFRQIGLDPDVSRIPGEEAAVARLFHGGFRSEGHVADALLIALLETGIPLWALDARCVQSERLGIRTSRGGECLGQPGDAPPLAPGTLVITDGAAVHSVLFGECSAHSTVTRHTTEVILYAVSVAGVPAIHIEEAFWLATEGLQSSG